MGSDVGARYGAQRGDDEIVEFGARSDGGRPWLSRVVVTCIVIAAVLAVFRSTHHTSHQQPQLPPSHHAVAPAQPAQLTSPTVVNVGHPVLGVTAGWQLFARGPDDLVAIQLARGLISETSVPVLQTSLNDVSFVVGPHAVIVHSPDNAPGYLIPDGRPAQLLTGVFANGGPVIPGPRPEQAWVMTGTSDQPTASLVTFDGHAVGETIRFDNRQSANTALPDGHGYLVVLANAPTWLYDVGPRYSRRIAGQITAVGPTRWLVQSCRGENCRYVVINPSTGSRRMLPGLVSKAVLDAFSLPPSGVVSPDGATAAVLQRNKHGQITIQLVDMRSGKVTSLNVAMDPARPNDTMAWSPDGKWLFIAATYGRLLAWNVRTRKIHDLGVQLPDITQVAIRPAAVAG